MKDDGIGGFVGAIIGICIVLCIVAAIVFFITFMGAIVGAFYSIKDYVLSFKENVVDANIRTA